MSLPRKMTFSKRLGRLVANGDVGQSIRSSFWADLLPGDTLKVCVGTDGPYERQVGTVYELAVVPFSMQSTTSEEVPYNMHDDVVLVDGVPVLDLEAFAFAEGFGDWVQCRSAIFDHCKAGFTNTYSGVLVTFTTIDWYLWQEGTPQEDL